MTDVWQGGHEINATLGLLQVQPLCCLFLVLTVVGLLLHHKLAIWSKDVRHLRRGSDEGSKLEGLAAAGVAAEAAAKGLAGAAAGPAAVALVGESGDQGKDEANDGAGKAKFEK